MSTVSSTESHATADLPQTPAHRALRAYANELQSLGGVQALLGWDEQTKMPHSAAAGRARQHSLVAGIRHERGTSDTLRRLIADVRDADPDSPEARVLQRDFDIATKLPVEFVREFASASSTAHNAWTAARTNDDFASFAPSLEHLVQLSRHRADLLGYEAEPWDALGDLYEEGMRAADIETVFETLRPATLALLEQQPEPDTSLLQRSYPIDRQRAVVGPIVASMGFDLDAGRIDPTAHPFCTTIGEGDVRLTTRYDEHWLPMSLFGTIHEAGHGIYEQSFARLGLSAPLGDVPGLGLHESQSRMYENIIGRSLSFWEHHFPTMQRAFPEALGDTGVEEYVRAINTVQRSLIRVEADELTYNLHIGLRFELERRLIDGTLAVADLQEAWRDAMQRWLGVEPTDDRDGMLQDVHWSSGSFGYFPTYTLGNVYSTQFVAAARTDLPDLDADLRRGDLSALVAWFDEHVYRHGCAYTGRELVERVTGGPISAEPLVAYLTERFGQR